MSGSSPKSWTLYTTCTFCLMAHQRFFFMLFIHRCKRTATIGRELRERTLDSSQVKSGPVLLSWKASLMNPLCCCTSLDDSVPLELVLLQRSLSEHESCYRFKFLSFLALFVWFSHIFLFSSCLLLQVVWCASCVVRCKSLQASLPSTCLALRTWLVYILPLKRREGRNEASKTDHVYACKHPCL